ncbi:hypothetical protein Glove_564g48 [Diversispora epigaea]|uniref:Uncharacterized protein n=1 Tax=Diversispora epigaea TaxID=1348612 RepID=A0A397GIV4_9GLOM|nr:hypothetical protein Glove_564g48 [Diversispora epigaea]
MQRASKHPSFSSLWHSYPHCAKLLLAFFLKIHNSKNSSLLKTHNSKNSSLLKAHNSKNSSLLKTQFQKSIFAENYEHFGTASQPNNLSCRLHFVYMQRASKHPSFSSLWHSYPHCAKSNVQGPKHHTGTHVTQQRSPRVRAFLLSFRNFA